MSTEEKPDTDTDMEPPLKKAKVDGDLDKNSDEKVVTNGDADVAMETGTEDAVLPAGDSKSSNAEGN